MIVSHLLLMMTDLEEDPNWSVSDVPEDQEEDSERFYFNLPLINLS